MATVTTPVVAWVATIVSAKGANQSSSVTVTVNITNGWEIQIPFKAQFSNVSNDATVNVYPSSDGGANYDTQPMYSFSIPMNTASPRTSQLSIRIPTGQYAIQILSSGPQSQSFSVLTQQVITSMLNQ